MPFTRSTAACARGPRSSSRRRKVVSGCTRRCSVHALGDERVDIQRLELDRSARWQNSENARTRRSSESISLDDDLRGLIDEGAVGRLPRLDLFDRQSNRRQRVLQLVRGLARERLPARHLREMDEPLAILAQLIGHAVERVDREADFVARGASPARGRCRRAATSRLRQTR